MNIFLICLAVVLGVVFLWGLLSPRTQWYALVGWTRSDPRETEPSVGAYTVSRFVSLLGLLGLLIIGSAALAGVIDLDGPGRTREPSAAEEVWGQPRSFVVDRVFTPATSAPEGLVDQRIEGYQLISSGVRDPRYLYETGRIRNAGQATEPGFLGVPPVPGILALDTADLVVHVKGDDRCIPQSIVLNLTDEAVQIGAFFGQPRPEDGSNDANIADCDPSPQDSSARGYLIPVDLPEPLGARMVQSLAGAEIPEVDAP